MIDIRVSENRLHEKRYVIDIIFTELLEIRYRIEVSRDEPGFEMRLANGNELIFTDYFFKSFKEGKEYIDIDDVPDKVIYVDNPFLSETNVPVIYGDKELTVSDNKIICGIDIFASAFFMLTRWEEYVNKARDAHGRFPARASLAYKNGFLHRPVVDEYVEMLWNMLSHLGIEQKRKTRRSNMLLTHDVDAFYKYGTFKSGIKEIGGDILKKGRFAAGIKKTKEKLSVHCGIRKDPYDTFDQLMNIAERAGLGCHFFLMSGGTSRYDGYRAIDKNVVDRIIAAGHEVGFHPSYWAYKDTTRFAEEKAEVERRTGLPVGTGRQHYLRFEAPTTWQVWEDNGMEWDSTLSYADKEGFRCGTSHEYSVFNFLSRQKLRLKEKPLIVMDGSFVTYQPDITPDEMESRIQSLVDKCRKYGGTFVFLWHNSSFGTPLWEPYGKVYENIVLKNTRETP